MCGENSHLMDSCPTKEKGTKCFKCSLFGHRAAQCGDSNGENREIEDKKMLCISEKSCAMKAIELCGKEVDALIDTGSDINAIRRKTFEKLNASELNCAVKSYKGIGGANVSVTSNFIGEMLIDDQTFISRIYIMKDTDIPVDGHSSGRGYRK